ncbi:hypothetical protein [Flaviaesturariibacter aridisoli]|uniref:Uncharacterized protein n=1 Tax=Flaviaesturariibacter aridisoli TaxID=2545761 RepID=A0A4R4DVS4_9BACT|nr:hypothetical protein [Flaviaesturariibacter aridisoli]TCZ64781.1 hypothetical protein E0486_17930 [Flaviaesturariibacter aridisoli]
MVRSICIMLFLFTYLASYGQVNGKGKRATPLTVGFEGWLDVDIPLSDLSKNRFDTSLIRTIRKELNLEVDSFTLDPQLSVGLSNVRKDGVNFRLSRYILTRSRGGSMNIEYEIQGGTLSNAGIRFIDAVRYQEPDVNGDLKYFISILDVDRSKMIIQEVELPEKDEALNIQNSGDSLWREVSVPYTQDRYNIISWKDALSLIGKVNVSYEEKTWKNGDLILSRKIGSKNHVSRTLLANAGDIDHPAPVEVDHLAPEQTDHPAPEQIDHPFTDALLIPEPGICGNH